MHVIYQNLHKSMLLKAGMTELGWPHLYRLGWLYCDKMAKIQFLTFSQKCSNGTKIHKILWSYHFLPKLNAFCKFGANSNQMEQF